MPVIEVMNYRLAWSELIKGAKEEVEASTNETDAYEIAQWVLPLAFKRYLFACYMDSIRQQYGTPWEPLASRAAAEMMVTHLHKWKPEEVRNLSDQDLMMSLHQELAKFKLTPEAMDVCKAAMRSNELSEYIEHHQPSSDPSEN